MISSSDQELIRLYRLRKGLRIQILTTHETMRGLGELPCVKRLNLEPGAIAQRAKLWPMLDEVNLRIRVIKGIQNR